MSLTDDWKAGKLDTTQRYWIIEKGFSKPIPRLMNELGEFIDNFGYPINEKGVKEVLAPCDYDYFIELTRKAEKYDNIKVNGNYPDKISKLKSRIKHLLDLQANQDKEVEKLWECLSHLTFDGISVTPLNILLDKINEALGNDK